MLVVSITSPSCADQLSSTVDGICSSTEPEPSYTVRFRALDWPVAIAKFDGSISILEIHGSTEGISIVNPELGLTGRIALSSAKRALVAIWCCCKSHLMPTMR